MRFSSYADYITRVENVVTLSNRNHHSKKQNYFNLSIIKTMRLITFILIYIYLNKRCNSLLYNFSLDALKVL